MVCLRPSFGTFDRVSMLDIADMLRETQDEVITLVHLYENVGNLFVALLAVCVSIALCECFQHIEDCVRLNLIFEDLAPQFTHVRFVRLRSQDAKEGFSQEGLPALLTYKGKEKHKSYARICPNHVPTVSDAAVMKFLVRSETFVCIG